MTIKGLDSLYSKFAKLKNIDIKPVMENVTAKVRDEARKRVPVDTAELKNSIDYIVDGDGSNYQGVVFSNKEHATYIELGTGPVGAANHSGISPNISPSYRPTPWVYKVEDNNMSAIFAKTGKVNKAKTKRMNKTGGKFVYTEGQKARPYLYPALKDNEEKIKKAFKTQVKKLIREASK